jgi:hypothetical protein
MPLFPCDNTDDIVPDEMYDSVRDEIETQQKKLGRMLTQEETTAIYEMEGLEPPTQIYRGGTHADHEFDQQE